MNLLDHNNEEKEVSTGSVIGKVLAIAAVLIIIAFIIFMVTKKAGKGDSTSSIDTPSIECVTESIV